MFYELHIKSIKKKSCLGFSQLKHVMVHEGFSWKWCVWSYVGRNKQNHNHVKCISKRSSPSRGDFRWFTWFDQCSLKRGTGVSPSHKLFNTALYDKSRFQEYMFQNKIIHQVIHHKYLLFLDHLSIWSLIFWNHWISGPAKKILTWRHFKVLG